LRSILLSNRSLAAGPDQGVCRAPLPFARPHRPATLRRQSSRRGRDRDPISRMRRSRLEPAASIDDRAS